MLRVRLTAHLVVILYRELISGIFFLLTPLTEYTNGKTLLGWVELNFPATVARGAVTNGFLASIARSRGYVRSARARTGMFRVGLRKRSLRGERHASAPIERRLS